MPEVGEKVKRNLKRRAEAVKALPKRELNIVKSSVRNLVSLKPVPAVVDLVSDTIENVGDFVKEQAAVTRSWVE